MKYALWKYPVHAVMSVRTPQGTIAWVASLITVPPVAVPAYWVFGRNKFRGYVLAHERELANLESIIRQANSQITGYPALPGHPDSCGTE